jgi:Family of unknown function (DUF6152)
MSKVLSAVSVAALIVMGSSVRAHHSGAMFEPTKSVEFDGTVKEFQWTNPHSWLQILGADGKGGVEEWSLELGPLVGLSRAGWKPRTLKPGDKVKVVFHPMRDGSRGGRLVSVTLPDGHVYNGQAGAPADAATVPPSDSAPRT